MEGDVSLASVAKDLGFDGRELTDMLERLPVEDTLDDNDIVDDSDGCFLGYYFNNTIFNLLNFLIIIFVRILLHKFLFLF